MASHSRSFRRAQDERMKARARRVMRQWFGRHSQEPDPRQVGLNASTHCRPCACWMCQAIAREVPQPRERAFDHPELPS